MNDDPSHHLISGQINHDGRMGFPMLMPIFSRSGGPNDPDTPETQPTVERRPVVPLPADIHFVDADWKVPPLAARRKMRQDFNNHVRREFIIWLALSQPDTLKDAGISQAEINKMRRQGSVPDGYEVHHKLPIAGGGDNSPSNLILIRRDIHDSIHAELDPQVAGLKEGESRRVRLPRPTGVFYGKPPAGPGIDDAPVMTETKGSAQKPAGWSRWLPMFEPPTPQGPSRFRL